MILVDAKGRSWPAKLWHKTSDGRAYIHDWNAFHVANDLHPGDSFILELVDKGEMPVFKMSSKSYLVMLINVLLTHYDWWRYGIGSPFVNHMFHSRRTSTSQQHICLAEDLKLFLIDQRLDVFLANDVMQWWKWTLRPTVRWFIKMEKQVLRQSGILIFMSLWRHITFKTLT